MTISELANAILRQDFDGLELSLPEDRLCPAVPVRFNYVRWLQQLLDCTVPSLDQSDADGTVTGLDIGTGASCIYSLLACASRPGWRMLATDIDTKSIFFARSNIDKNNMASRIQLRQTSVEGPLLDLGNDIIDFTICNPPFYESEDDMHAAYGSKEMPPSAVCTGSINEMICEGGDLGFATRILEESKQLRARVRWYSCMLCRLVSAKALVQRIKEAGITNFAVTNLRAGQKTVRWAVAWSFHGWRPDNNIARHGSLVVALLPLANERSIAAPGRSAEHIAQQVNSRMESLDLEWWASPDDGGIATAKNNVWSRSARRRGGRETYDKAAVIDQGTARLIVEITCSDGQAHLRWIFGHDVMLWESFSGMLRQALGQRRGLG